MAICISTRIRQWRVCDDRIRLSAGTPAERCRGRQHAALSRCTASTASAATTPSTCARWAATRSASRRCSSRSRPDAVVANGAARALSARHGEPAPRDRAGGGDRARRPRHRAAGRALEHVFGYAVGNDLTRRDLQHAAKKRGQPWDTGKGFDHSAPIGAIRPVDARPRGARAHLARRSTASCARSRTSPK